MAYVDQLMRDGALSAEYAKDLGAVLERAGPALAAGSTDKNLAKQLKSLAKSVPGVEEGGRVAARSEALEETLLAMAARLS